MAKAWVGVAEALAASVAAAVLYGSNDLLTGEFIYDDGGAVCGNPIVTGDRPLSDVWQVS